MVSTTMSLLCLSLHAPLTLHSLTWCIDGLPRSTGSPCIQAIVDSRVPLMIVGSISYLLLMSPHVCARHWQTLPSVDASCTRRYCVVDESDSCVMADAIVYLVQP